MSPSLDQEKHMERHPIWLLALSLYVFAQPGHAELQLDLSKKPKQVEATLRPLFESVVRPYGDRHSPDFGWPWGKNGTSTTYEGSNFLWTFNGVGLFSNVGSFTPEIAQLEDCKSDSDKLYRGHGCDWRRNRFNVCHLFLFNSKDLKLESVTRLDIVRDKKQLVGLPLCLNIQAMAIAKDIPDAMLITMSYIDSAERADPKYDPPEFYSTVLLRFSDESGKLKIEQDDSCLGNPNKYKTIAAARKALTNCAKVQK